MLDLDTLNRVSENRFVDLLGHIAEDSPFVARRAAQDRPFADHEALVTAFVEALNGLDADSQLSVLCAHPDLAGKLDMADASRREQKGAGLDTLTAAERDLFQRLNAKYRQKFGFPFIFAVKGATKHQILDAFEQRLPRDRDTERKEALTQVATIMRWRLVDTVRPLT
jgi:2-oxo-4-hydroxy-4-carboxy-5-ureidoimidazoline decarboxylase